MTNITNLCIPPETPISDGENCFSYNRIFDAKNPRNLTLSKIKYSILDPYNFDLYKRIENQYRLIRYG